MANVDGDEDFDIPDLPDETQSSSRDCDMYEFFNALQFPWQRLFVDTRNAEEFQATHPRYSVNVPFGTGKEEMIQVLKGDIEPQQDIVDFVYIYNTEKDAETTQQHIASILDLLNKELTLFPQVFLFNDPESVFLNKYPFLCIHDGADNIDEETDEKKEAPLDAQAQRVKEFRELMKSLAPKPKPNQRKSYLTLLTERIGTHLEYPEQIVNDRLFLGDYNAATRRQIMTDLGITHVVNCTELENEFEGDEELKIQYFQIPVHDLSNEPIADYFEKAVEFMENAMAQKKENRVFVHCAAGVSRSSTITIAYLMKTTGMNMEDALKYVQERRSCVEPNDGFKLQLKHYAQNGYKIDRKVLNRIFLSLQ